ncbi:MAG: hypothetical protein KKE37_08695 [Verrucomicrobia bacterium]|nr:hypothetical protein [Verrucomicrobiota bacterium]MBU4290168.1 hypothetical protein [Verrucomicrobiota bacterium]MBU4429413.1 hypothetical protein [Verrucomicrobiota bacterium]MCG2681428.1 hypothetical protein [Kiritimatiellia bacterium]
MTKRFGLCVVGLWMMATIGFGQAPADTPPPDDIGFMDPMSMNPNELMTRVNEMLQQGNTNSAINMLMIGHAMNLSRQASTFGVLLNNLLATGNLPEAERIYQENMAQQDRLTRDYFNLLHTYYDRQGDKQALLEWTTSLQARAMPQDFRAQAFGWLLDASRSLGPVSRVTQLVPVCITNFNVSISWGLLNGAIEAYNKTGDLKAANSVCDALERAARRQPELRLLVTCQRVKLLFSAGRWPEAETCFKKEASAIPDQELLDCFQRALAYVGQTNQFDLKDRLCEWVLKKAKNKPATWQAAARTWLETAQARKAIADIPVRFDALIKLGYADNELTVLFYKYWRVILKDGKPANLTAMIKIGERLAAAMPDKQEKEWLGITTSEGYFMLENYERALKLMEDSVAIMERPEQEIIVNKIKAHLALQKGNKQEAIERFRMFMDSVKGWTRTEEDPISGLYITKEMCLGLNARRIGDIMSSMNDAQGAQAAFQEADGYYTTALKEAKANSPEVDYIKTRQAELSRLMKK